MVVLYLGRGFFLGREGELGYLGGTNQGRMESFSWSLLRCDERRRWSEDGKGMGNVEGRGGWCVGQIQDSERKRRV